MGHYKDQDIQRLQLIFDKEEAGLVKASFLKPFFKNSEWLGDQLHDSLVDIIFSLRSDPEPESHFQNHSTAS